MLNAMQVVLLCILLMIPVYAVKPPGYVEPKKEEDPDPPKYEYGYNIANDQGDGQGKQEQRDGIHASGRYFVQGKDSNQEVQYFADDWGYHPAVEYSSVGPYSRSSAQFALDHEAVQQLKNKKNKQPQLHGLPDTGNLDKQGSRISLEKLSKSIDQGQKDVQIQSTTQQSANEKNVQFDVRLPEIPKIPQINPEHIPQEKQSIKIAQNIQLSSHQGENSQTSNEGLPLRGFFPQYLTQVQPQAQALTQITPNQDDSRAQENFIESLEPQNQNTISSLEQYEQVKESAENYIPPKVQEHISKEENTLETSKHHQEKSVSLENDISKTSNNIGILDTLSHNYDLNQPQKLVQLNDYITEYSGRDGYSEFGLRINKLKNEESNKLVESTQHLVSGQDVLDINSAITEYQESNTKINSQETNTEYKTSDVTSVSTTTESSIKESSFNGQPIIVADSLEIDVPSSTSFVESNQEESYSTAKSTAWFSSTASPLVSTVVVTPRPVSTKFLAPITAGIRLQNVEKHTEEREQIKNNNKMHIEVQESIPYYLGKYEYPISYEQHVNINNSSISSIDEKAKENIELGKTLLYFPSQGISVRNQPIADVDNHITIQQLPGTDIKNQFLEIDQEQAQGYQNQVTVQHTPDVEQAPKEVTKVIHEPYPVEVPYSIVKQVEIPRTIQKVIEKPIHITRYVEKPVRIPQPIPVEKVVEKPVHIPVHITKYIDRPYPVEVRVPYPQPFPVERVVQKIVKQPYPVEVRVPVQVEKIVEKKVPHYIEKPVPVEKIVEKPVPHYIDRPYPVEKIVEKPVTQYVDRPYPVEKIIEKPVPHYIDRPYPVEVKVPVEKIVEKKVPHYVDRPYPVEKIVEKPVPHYIDRPYPVEKIVEKQVPQYIDRPYPVEVKVPVEKIVEKKIPLYVDRPYPVEKIVEKPVPHYIDRPYPVEKVVEKPVPHFVDQSYPVAVKVPVQQSVNVDFGVTKSNRVQFQHPYFSQIFLQQSYTDQTKYQPKEQYVQQSQPEIYITANPYAYAPQINKYIPPKKNLILNNGYLPPRQIPIDYLQPFQGDAYLPPIQADSKYPQVQFKQCGYHTSKGNILNHDNIGLLPPKIFNGAGPLLRIHRNARSHFDSKNIKMEHGFLPPMVPSLEIDDMGNPIEKK
nr:uncharacterized protein LOC111508187 [Leptinotarsa decemlineata]